MGPKISICRKKDHVYLKLMGSFNPASAQEILQTLERVVRASLKFTSLDSMVFFTFRTHARVNLGKPAAAPLKTREPQALPMVTCVGDRLGKLLH